MELLENKHSLNIRQQKYKQNRLLGMNIYNAARAAGYSHNYAVKNGKRIEMLGNVGMLDSFEQAGITDKVIIKDAIEGLGATKLQSVNFKTHHVPDWTVRHKYFESICKMTGRLKEAVVNITNKNTTIHNHPGKVFIFKSIDDTNRITTSGDIHGDEGTEGAESSISL